MREINRARRDAQGLGDLLAAQVVKVEEQDRFPEQRAKAGERAHQLLLAEVEACDPAHSCSSTPALALGPLAWMSAAREGFTLGALKNQKGRGAGG
jgi:hypothetical protein